MRALAAEVFDMLPERVQASFAVGAALPLHRFKMCPDLRLVRRINVIP
jgi:hypothetical protein